MPTETDIFHDVGSSGWSGDIEKYHLNAEQLDELLYIYSYQHHPRRDQFSFAINKSVGKFCHGVRQYNAKRRCMAGDQKQKITTRLRKISSDISKDSAQLISHLAPLTNQELEWIFGSQFDDYTDLVHAYDQFFNLLGAFQRYAETAGIEVSRSTPSLVMPFTRQCINIVEHFTGTTVVAETDKETGRNESTFSSFMVTVWHHIPGKIKNTLPQKVDSFESIIKAAIAENKRLTVLEGL